MINPLDDSSYFTNSVPSLKPPTLGTRLFQEIDIFKEPSILGLNCFDVVTLPLICKSEPQPKLLNLSSPRSHSQRSHSQRLNNNPYSPQTGTRLVPSVIGLVTPNIPSPRSPKSNSNSNLNSTIPLQYPRLNTVYQHHPTQSPTFKNTKPSSPTLNIINPSSPTFKNTNASSPTLNIIKPSSPTLNIINPSSPTLNIIKPSSPRSNIINPSESNSINMSESNSINRSLGELNTVILNIKPIINDRLVSNTILPPVIKGQSTTKPLGLVMPKLNGPQKEIKQTNNPPNKYIDAPKLPQLVLPMIPLSPGSCPQSSPRSPSNIPGVSPGRSPQLRQILSITMTPSRIRLYNKEGDEMIEEEDDPWLPKPVPKITLKIAGITPLGCIAPVPTGDRPPTPRHRRYVSAKTEVHKEEGNDPVMETAIYLDCNKSDREYGYVAQRMRNITSIISESNDKLLQKQYANQYQQLPNITGKQNSEQFEKALSIYENNQVYYQDRIDDNNMSLEEIKAGLTKLEHWFIAIIEPKPTDKEEIRSWKDRETLKLTKGWSSYCDPDLYQYIQQPLPDDIIKFVKQHHSKLLI